MLRRHKLLLNYVNLRMNYIETLNFVHFQVNTKNRSFPRLVITNRVMSRKSPPTVWNHSSKMRYGQFCRNCQTFLAMEISKPSRFTLLTFNRP